MIIELPKKINIPFVDIADGHLIIEQMPRYEDLMYELTYAQKKKKCVYCGVRLRECNRTLDHRYPRDTGGVSITNNLFPCCHKCNSAKGNLTHKEYLESRDLLKRERREYVKELRKQKEEILGRIGYILPTDWVEYIDLNEIKYQKPSYDFRGKKYYRILEFYNQYKKLPRPIVVDKENQLLDGYNIIIFAKDLNIQYIPVIKLENVVVIKYHANEENPTSI